MIIHYEALFVLNKSEECQSPKLIKYTPSLFYNNNNFFSISVSDLLTTLKNMIQFYRSVIIYGCADIQM